MTVTSRAPRCADRLGERAAQDVHLGLAADERRSPAWAVTAVGGVDVDQRYAGTGSGLPLSVSSTRSTST